MLNLYEGKKFYSLQHVDSTCSLVPTLLVYQIRKSKVRRYAVALPCIVNEHQFYILSLVKNGGLFIGTPTTKKLNMLSEQAIKNLFNSFS